MKRFALMFMAGAMMFPVALRAQPQQAPQQPVQEKKVAAKPFPDAVVYSYFTPYGSATLTTGRSHNFSPTFIIYPDTPLDESSAKTLVSQLGIEKIMPDNNGSLLVVNPSNKKYDAEKDFELFVTLYNTLRSGNLKVIGVGAGATFVNSVIAPKAAGYISGILTIGGEKGKLDKKEKYPGVPAYVAGKKAAKVAEEYKTINSFVKDEPLLKVVVNEEPNAALDAIFDDAWQQILGTCYRFNNYKHTHYYGSKFGEYGVGELEPYLICDRYGITCDIVVFKERYGGGKPWLWYEYWPNEIKEGAKEKSVPVMVLLHGNTNDPRTQAETSGFIQVQAEERFFVVEMEWQGTTEYDAMGQDGVEEVINYLLNKYPQLDPSRVYCEGLSAGSITATALGIKKSHLFAAVGGHSGGMIGGRGMSYFSSFGALWAEATQKRGAVEMPYC
ncbi:MAG: hypothetical protein HUJ90_05360, partial [Bacteroidales bacterium]|nr:hypothetical protein [Bacteroidales bacterium]